MEPSAADIKALREIDMLIACIDRKMLLQYTPPISPKPHEDTPQKKAQKRYIADLERRREINEKNRIIAYKESCTAEYREYARRTCTDIDLRGYTRTERTLSEEIENAYRVLDTL